MFEKIHLFFSPNTTSEQWRLNIKDFAKGLTMAVISAIVEMAYEMAKAGQLSVDWAMIGHASAVATFTYLLKNLATKPAAPTS